MIQVLLVEDSPLGQDLMKCILTSDKDIEVIGIVRNGIEALRFLETTRPDIIIMDLNIAYVNGFKMTERIMETNPVPIIMVTALSGSTDDKKRFQAIQAGAISITEKPTSIYDSNYKEICKNIINNVKLMSEIKVVKRKFRKTINVKKSIETEKNLNKEFLDKKIVVIGVSTGGPPILNSIFSQLNEDIPVPILVVQHITQGFINGLVDWLRRESKLPIHIAENEEKILPGHIYFAPDDYHMEIRCNGMILLNKKEKVNGLRPAVSYLFGSVADVYGKRSIGILLSGMGRDGVEELKILKDKGAITIAQDKESSVVYGMPGEAVKINATIYILSPQKIAELLNEL